MLSTMGETSASNATASKAQSESTTASHGPSGWGTSAFFRDKGKPVFPSLYKMHGATGAAGETTLKAFKQASQQAFSTAQTNWKKGIKLAQSSFSRDEKSIDCGQKVQTPYGAGVVEEFRTSTKTYVVRLAFGGTLYTQDTPVPKYTNNKGSLSSMFTKKKSVVELNDAFVQWEAKHQAEVEAECIRLGIPFEEDIKHQCFACVKETTLETKKAEKATRNTALFADSTGNPMFPRLHKLRVSTRDIITTNTQQVRTAVTKNDAPCLLCATVCCGKHSSSAFRKENVTLCLDCVKTVESNQFQISKTLPEVEAHTNQLYELYERALILLQYCDTYIEVTAEQLEQQTKQHNEIAGVGGSSVGLASGILGVAAACTILTPMGPPLLLGSLVMGGSATAVQAGGEAYKYYSEPNQLANRIMTLHSIVVMILDKIDSMRNKTLIPYLEEAAVKLEVIEQLHTSSMSSDTQTKVARLSAGACIGSTAATSAAASLAASEGAMAGRFVSRATTAAARTARFARFAGGALSAATLVLEARELRRTLDQIEKGHPCEKAELLRKIHGNLENLPSRNKVRRTCRSYVKVRSREIFQEAMTGALILPASPTEENDTPSAPAVQPQDDWYLVEEVVASLEDSTMVQDEGSSITSGASYCNIEDDKRSVDSFEIAPERKASLLRRLILFKEREARKDEDAAVDLVV
jgi:guanyl-specific ribonuclease Sa